MELIQRMLRGEKAACARLISLVENESQGYREILKEIYRESKGAYVVGITGPPGAGKSTLTDKLTKALRKKNKKVGIIAVDPTSPYTRGAILGDRIRMADLYLDEGVFIRSMGTRGHLGGVSKATLGAIKILDAFGCDYIFVETVGVGQSEVEIVSTTDTVLMVMVPGLGDDIQAIKAGVMEIGDVFVVNKADKDGAKKTLREIEMMLDFNKDWTFRPPVSLAVAETGEGVDEVLANILSHQNFLEESDQLKERRMARNLREIKEVVRDALERKINETIEKEEKNAILLETVQGEKDPYTVAEELLQLISNQ